MDRASGLRLYHLTVSDHAGLLRWSAGARRFDAAMHGGRRYGTVFWPRSG
jgi:hypothetical protein